jgi:ATP-binding protein involved in chromosome partitioning
VLVTQPQEVAVSDVVRAAAMFDTLNVPILGVVENMAGDFFGSGGGEKFADERGVPFLGRIPLDAEVRKGGDYGRPVVVHQPESAAGQALQTMAQTVAARISVVMLQTADVIPLTVIG